MKLGDDKVGLALAFIVSYILSAIAYFLVLWDADGEE